MSCQEWRRPPRRSDRAGPARAGRQLAGLRVQPGELGRDADDVDRDVGPGGGPPRGPPGLRRGARPLTPGSPVEQVGAQVGRRRWRRG